MNGSTQRGAYADSSAYAPPIPAGHRRPGSRSDGHGGGPTPQLHLAVDGRCLPLSIVFTPDDINDCTAFPRVLAAIAGPRHGSGRPRCRPDRMVADKAHNSAAIRRSLRVRGIAATIPERADQQAGRGSHGGRPPVFDPALSKRRNVVWFCW